MAYYIYLQFKWSLNRSLFYLDTFQFLMLSDDFLLIFRSVKTIRERNFQKVWKDSRKLCKSDFNTFKIHMSSHLVASNLNVKCHNWNEMHSSWSHAAVMDSIWTPFGWPNGPHVPNQRLLRARYLVCIWSQWIRQEVLVAKRIN